MPATRTSTEFAVLGLLTLKPMSGYEMRQLVAQSIGHFWSESYGQLYPSLKRLQSAGLVTKTTDPLSKRDKHIYSITDSGRTALAKWLKDAPKPQPPRSELLLKLFFLPPDAAQTSIEHVTRARDRAIDDLRHLGYVEEKIRSEHANHPQLQQWLFTLSFGRHRAEAVVRWADGVLNDLAATQQTQFTKGGSQ
jgi:DNA-binding PadR family transcriptional regulator